MSSGGDKPDESGEPSKPQGATVSTPVGQVRLRYLLVAVVTAVWVVDIATVLFGSSTSPQPLVFTIFMVVVGWVLGIDVGVLGGLGPRKRDGE